MGARGRKSIASLVIGTVETIPRPPPPYDLTDDEAAEWEAIVAAMPADHFKRMHYPLLSQLCRHTVASHRIAMLVEQSSKRKAINVETYAALLRMQATETTSIVRLMRAMRLTQQSIMRADNAKARPLSSLHIAPWERHDTDDD